MTEKRPQLRVITGTPRHEEPLDLVHLFEEMDARDALPILRKRMRQQTAAANSALSIVEPSSTACRQAAPAFDSTN